MGFLKSREELILEKRLELLLESEIVYSDKFKTALRSIDDDISKKLLELDNKDIDTNYNFIDITKNNNVVSFTPDNRVQSMLSEVSDKVKVIADNRYLTHSHKNDFIFNALNYEKPQGDPYTPGVGVVGRILNEHGEKTTRSGNTYVVFQSEDGDKTVLNKLALIDYDDNKRKIWSTARNNVRVGRLTRYLLQRQAGAKFSDSDIELFVNKFKSHIDVLNDAFSKFDIVSGDDITYWYDCDRYSEGDDGVLGSSCMAGMSDDTFCLYANNPSKVQMVILYDDSGSIQDGRYKSNYIKGRALLWYIDPGTVDKPDIIFMERIYTHNDSDVELFREYALRNGWYYKSTNTYTTNFTMIGKSTSLTGPWSISLNVQCDEFPYVDSFQYINFAKSELSTSVDVWRDDEGRIDEDDIGVLTDTGGGYENWYE